jgi:hypothetical protein
MEGNCCTKHRAHRCEARSAQKSSAIGMGFPPKDGTIRGFWIFLEKFEKPFLLRACYLGLLVHFSSRDLFFVTLFEQCAGGV